MKRVLRTVIALTSVVLVLFVSSCSKTEAERMQDVRRYFDQGELPSATIELKNVLQANPNAVEARFLLGKALYAAGDTVGAEVELRRALDAGYSEDEAVPLLATVMVTMNRHSAVIKEFGDRDLKRPEADAELKNQVALAYLAGGAVDDADRALAVALRKAPGYQAAYETRVRLEAARGDVVSAQAMADALIQRRPDNAAAWVLKGDVYFLSNDADKAAAQEAYGKALTLRPDMVSAHAGLLAMMLAVGDFDAGRKQIQALKAVQPNHPQTQFFETMLALHDGQTARAQQLVQNLVRGAPDNPRLLALAGQVELQAGSLAQAETYLLKSISLVPSAQPPRRLLAELYIRTGQPRRALDVLEPLLASKAGDPGAAILAGQAYLMSGDVASAEAAYARAAKGRPDDIRVRTGLAMAQISKGQVQAGVDALRSIASSDPSATADLALIGALTARKQFPAALDAVDRYASKVPGQVHPDYLRGRIALAAGDKPEARKQMSAAVAKQPAYLSALYALGELDQAEGKPGEALARFRSALQQDSSNVSLRVALADFVARTGGSKDEVVSLLKESIRARPADPGIRANLIDYALSIGDISMAQDAARDAQAALPSNPVVLDRVGLVQQASGDLRQAIATYQTLASVQPNSAPAQLRLVDAYLALKNYDAARLHARRAMELAPDSTLAQRTAVLVALRSGRNADAMAIARTVKQRRGADAIALQLEGEVELAQRNYDAAAASFRKSLDARASTEVARLLHMALTGAKRGADAEKFAQAWLAVNPDDVVFILHLGDTALNQNDLQLAEQRFRQVLERKPNNLEALNNAAYVLALQKKAGAVEFGERATKLAPNRPPLMDTLAFSYAAEGKLPQALELQARVVGMSPEEPEFRLTLAKLQLQSGDKAAARENLLKLQKYGRDYPKQIEVEKLLKDTGG